MTGAGPAALRPGGQLGRFELRRQIGQGAQASVWLAWDDMLQREVAIKILLPEEQLDHALHEARAMGALRHPHIVPVHEAHVAPGLAWLVMTAIDGCTLAERLRGGALPAQQAVRLCSEVLSALGCAHAAGIVHRDIKPSNILLDSQGHAHVADFGIAARSQAGHDGVLVGSAGYISPEAAAGAAPEPAMDLFAVGLLLGEMLCGQPLRMAVLPELAMARAREVPVTWPASCGQDVDDRLRHVVLRAVAHDPAQRFASVSAFEAALQAWWQPLSQAQLELPGDASQGPGADTLAFLLRRMRQTGDFPALSDSVVRIQRITASESDSVHVLAAEILKDVALTNKLLRLVNTAGFLHSGAGEVSTVSRAAALIGFSGIRNLAMSVMLLEHMRDQSRARRMKELFLQALLTAMLTDQLTPPSAERETAFLAGMLSHLGRLLVAYLFPDEAQAIRERSDGTDLRSETRAAVQVLGLSLDQLGQGVARSWGLPDSLRLAMHRPEGDWPRRLVPEADERLRWRVRAAGEMVQLLLNHEPAHTEVALRQYVASVAPALGLGIDAVIEAVQLTRVQLSGLASDLQIEPSPHSQARRLLGEDPAGDTTLVMPPPPARMADLLSAGLAEVTQALLADSPKLNDVLRALLESLLRALKAQRVLLALRDARTGQLAGRLAMGEGADALSRRCTVDVTAKVPADVFAAACIKGLDTLITDARAPDLRPRLPGWYRDQVPVSFALLPLMLKAAPVGFLLIECDHTLQVDHAELSLLRALRNQALLALKTAH